MYGVYYGYTLQKINQTIIKNIEMKIKNQVKTEKNIERATIIMVTKL